MRISLIYISSFCIIFSFCTESITGENYPPIIILPVDTTATKIDSCENKLLNLQTLTGCPEYVGGQMNQAPFSGLADINLLEHLGPDYSAIVVRSFRSSSGYALEMFFTLNGEPEAGVPKPLTTQGDNLAATHVVGPDSSYVLLGMWLDVPEFYPPITYKVIPFFSNWIRVDSSRYTTYEGEPVTDHFGALEATLVLNQSEYVQDNMQYYLDRGFCVPDTIFLRDVCFDARTRDVDGPCRRKAGR